MKIRGKPMAKHKNRNARAAPNGRGGASQPRLKPETKKSVWGVVFLGGAAVLALSGFRLAGPVGDWIFSALSELFGVGYFILPTTLGLFGVAFIAARERAFFLTTLAGGALLMLAVLGTIEIAAKGRGGYLGLVLGSLQIPFGKTAALVINIAALVSGILITLNAPLRISLPKRAKPEVVEPRLPEPENLVEEPDEEAPEDSPEEAPGAAVSKKADVVPPARKTKKNLPEQYKNYIFPPLSLLESTAEKPTTGDLRANANIVKRTLENFGIPVEMSEVNIGPKVTRYTLKPAEGVKLSRITALNQDLALALAAHPIRIEAPIPGKSLVGIEVPNKAAALVRLGSLMHYPEFQGAGLLGFTLGRDVSGDPVFTDIEKMPHLLIAGATGSGKSVVIHSLIVSLLYKNSPGTLKLVLIDPKRVELSIYEGLPHLVSPVITDNKQSVAVFRWAIKEMERRYDVLLKSGRRDIKGYNAAYPDEALPYLLIVVDELADLMSTYGREVEGSIIRLAQMARATGLHLILSTQRPSVEVITGLIKANITNRIALQVASQIDSRTILDASGAEKLLGGGDLLFIASNLSKPKRIQGAYIPESEIRAVVDFIRKNNRADAPEEGVPFGENGEAGQPDGFFEEAIGEDKDELYGQAVKIVAEAKKASASLLQRRLKVGYARAARLLDIMESNGVIGPGDGAKPREVFLDNTSL